MSVGFFLDQVKGYVDYHSLLIMHDCLACLLPGFSLGKKKDFLFGQSVPNIVQSWLKKITCKFVYNESYDISMSYVIMTNKKTIFHNLLQKVFNLQWPVVRNNFQFLVD